MKSPRASARAPHRATADVVLQRGDAMSRALYQAFAEYNAAHFGGMLGSPLVQITAPSNPRRWGDYAARDEMGLESVIRIAPWAVREGERVALDVLLHEMVHAWVHEIDGNVEPSYRGHGPRFAAMCNRIGEKLGLRPVGVKGRKGLPDCNHWPHNVRPAGYYPKPFKTPRRSNVPTDLQERIRMLGVPALAELAELVRREIDSRA